MSRTERIAAENRASLAQDVQTENDRHNALRAMEDALTRRLWAIEKYAADDAAARIAAGELPMPVDEASPELLERRLELVKAAIAISKDRIAEAKAAE